MLKMKPWIIAARLRTLPLAFSSIILGTCLAASFGYFSGLIFSLCLLTALSYQLLSNFANDYGDGIKGTDASRKREQRVVATGIITAAQMKKAVWLFGMLSFVFGTYLSMVATRGLPKSVTSGFIILGLLAIVAAVTYTVGRRAYGYRGFGDISVLLFFGWVGVMGSFFLQANTFSWEVFLPATSVGLLAIGVLNLNNMRDIETDRTADKRTIAVLLGLRGAKIYHGTLIVIAFDLVFVYNILVRISFWQNLYLLSLPLLLLNLYAVIKTERPEDFDPLLKVLAITTFIFSVLFGIGQVI